MIIAFAVTAPVLGCGRPLVEGIEADGAASSGSSGTGEAAGPRPNWHEDVAPVVHARCVGCHSAEGIAPVSFDGYATTAEWAALIAAAVEDQSMPPWGAHDTPECQPGHGWVDDLRLSEAERGTLLEWIDIGAPEGDPAEAAALPDPQVAELDDASAVLQIPAPITVVGPNDSYSCISIDPGLDAPVWVTGAQMQVDNLEVVHHVIMMLDETGATAELAGPDGSFPCTELHEDMSWFGSHFPGSGPTLMPAGVGAPLPVGGRVVLSFHYHPTDAPEDIDHSSVALRWTAEEPAYDAIITAVGNAATAAQGLEPGPNDPDNIPTFWVPPGESAHTETMSAVFPAELPDAELFMLTPHMHAVGSDFRVTLERGGQASCLIQDPHWDPSWQLVYNIDAAPGELPLVSAGDRIELRCTYDNSLANPGLVEVLAELGLDEPIDVYLGAEGVNEMCMLIYGVAIPN